MLGKTIPIFVSLLLFKFITGLGMAMRFAQILLKTYAESTPLRMQQISNPPTYCTLFYMYM
jgi:hypothetical protein